jgi:nucleotidyltransferase/DNA polymerase involved in DNA repair
MTGYREESQKIMRIIAETGAVIEQMSIDEAYLDFSEVVERAASHSNLPRTFGSETSIQFTEETAGGTNRGRSVPPSPLWQGRRQGEGLNENTPAGRGLPLTPTLPREGERENSSPVLLCDEALYRAVPMARDLKRRIFMERCLTASIGIAANKLLAKLASDFQKPDGLTLIPERDKVLFLRPMPIRSIHGVGKVTEQVLNQAGVFTVGDLQDYPGDLRALVGSWGPILKRFAFGDDDRPLELGDEIKSISSENTFLRDTADRKVLRGCLREQADEISAKLKHKRLGAQTVQVKVRYSDFTTLTRQITVEEPISETSDIYRLGCLLLSRHKLVSRPLRLLGLGVSGLAEPSSQQLILL